MAVVDLQPGDTVLDLGSGGGIDVLLSARRVGPTGFAYGLDATVEMLELARRNAVEAGATNVEFLHGSIEQIPLDDASVDVVISNCVIVLSGDKDATFAEIARVLRPGGRVGISDIVPPAPTTGRRPASRVAPARSRPTPTRTLYVTPGSARSRSRSPMRLAPACPTPSSPPPSPPSTSARCTTRTGRRCGTSDRSRRAQADSSWRLPIRVSTRLRISSRIGRTASTPRPAGSSSSQSS